MTTHPHDPLTDLTAATRTHAEEVYATRVPDFAAMLARARELDPDLVSEASTAHAEALAPVIPIQHAHRDRSDHDALAPFTAATRAILAEQATRPALPRPPPPPLVRPRRTLALGLTALVALAAALLLWQGPRVATLLTSQSHNVAAVADSPDEPPQPLHDSPPARTAPRERPTPILAPSEPVLAPEPVLTPAEPASPRARRPAPAPAPAPAPTLPLEDEAQALWQRGEIGRASCRERV